MKFGLIGYPIGHSLSKKYFVDKFSDLGLYDFTYELISVPDEDALRGLLRDDFFGLNITIPYKTAIIHYLNEIDPVALRIGAVNTIVRSGRYSWKGFNTDVHGFRTSLMQWYGNDVLPSRALVLGSGGSSKAVCHVLHQLGVETSVVSRADKGQYRYEELTQEVIKSHLLIVNTTPLGMMPEVDTCPQLLYEYFTPQHHVFDLVYNPWNTLFLRRSAEMGAETKNGLDMLYIQAEHAWSIWKQHGKF